MQPLHVLIAAVALGSWWQSDCPSVHNEFYLMPNGKCDKGLSHLIFEDRCLSAAASLGLTLKNDTILIYSDTVNPKGCFYITGLGMLGYNDKGTSGTGSQSNRAICTRGTRILTWGLSSNGGNSTTVGSELHDVTRVYSNDWAFVALKVDGSIVAWGDSDYGGDATGVVKETIKAVYTSSQAFAALSHSGRVFTWGKRCSPSAKGDNCGGNSSSVASLISSDVGTIFSTTGAFAALKADKTVVAWGSPSYGGDTTTVDHLLTNVQTIYSNDQSFTALTTNGTVVSWGGSIVAPPDVRIVTVSSTKNAFAGLLLGGGVVAWGLSSSGGDSSTVDSELTDVVGITGNSYTFAAWKENGTVVTWGRSTYGSNASTVASQLIGVQGIAANSETFVALKTSFKSDWAAVAWGGGVLACCGGNATDVSSLLSSNVQTIYAAESAYAALLTTGKVVTWGSIDVDKAASDNLDSDVQVLCSSRSAFAAIKTNGSVVAWGNGLAANLSIIGMPLNEVGGTAVLLASAGQAYAVGIAEQPLPNLDTGISDGAGIALAICFGVFALSILVGGPLYIRYRKRKDRATRRARIRSYRRSYHAPRKPLFDEPGFGDGDGYRSDSEVSD